MSQNVVGPVEFAVLELPGSRLTGDVAPALAELVEQGVVGIIDLAFLSKDVEGVLQTFELADLASDVAEAFDAIDGDAGGLFAEDDLREVGSMLKPDSSAILVMWEAAWARRLATAVLQAGGQMVLHERIDRDAINELLAESAS